MKRSVDRLHDLCSIIPPLLNGIDEEKFSTKPGPEKWSKKEIIGHLIDSATNNHHRLVRGQFENAPYIPYDQNKWNECNYYQQMASRQIISFWSVYNKHLVELIKCIPNEKMGLTVGTGEPGNKNLMTLEYLIDDYVEHLEHHLRQVVRYPQKER